ncbi:hypothetical protein [Petrotoga olearia]|uniref:Uncharacterized protein n=2 Tax=Petrotoga olearia TaxID=156203 RepID=A0A2K1NZE6_9BACT|nr:hypothetical protein [Petrotoga olearia]PNR95901.1 hypothetical protein X929_06845 [Petrotoga olearia DSM 13574]
MFSERKLSSLLSFSKNTVSKCLSELEDRGLITCYPRKGNGLTANKEDSLTANEEGSLTANEEDSLKRPERGSRKGSLTANVKGKEAFSSTFWFPEVQLRETGSSAQKGVQGKTGSQQMRKTASRQMRAEKKDVYNKGVRYNVHGAENSLTANKGGSKYAKFF